MRSLSAATLLVVCASCHSNDSPKQPAPPPPSDSRAFVIKPVATPHEPTPDELGPAVDVKTGYEALCAAVPPTGAKEDGLAYIRGALFAYPNPEVIRFVASLPNMAPGDQAPSFRKQLDAAGVGSCQLYDRMAARTL